MACTEIENISIQNTTLENCVKASNHTLGKVLGSGEQGVTYSLADDEGFVIKATPFNGKKMAWQKESCISIELGKLGVGPFISKTYACGDKGFIVMQRLKVADQYNGKAIRQLVGKKEDNHTKDHIAEIPESVQKQYVSKFEQMSAHGYVHMDNHLGNMGYTTTDNTPILFDFGFTQKRKLSETDKLVATALSCFIVIEKCPDEEIKETYFYKFAMDALKPLVSHHRDMTDTRASIEKSVQSISTSNPDIYVATFAYVFLCNIPWKSRFDSSLQDVIYSVRDGSYTFPKKKSPAAKKGSQSAGAKRAAAARAAAASSE